MTMRTATGRQIIYWRVRCVNRQTKEMFDRILLLDEDNISPAERGELVSLLAEKRRQRELLGFRKFFKECNEEEFAAKALGCGQFSPVSMEGYFEDEAGSGLGEVGLMQILSGQENPIIAGNAHSVLRLGPSSINDKPLWTVEKANDIAHYLDLCRRLAKSRWLQAEMTLQVSPTLDLVFPDDEATDSALLAIRQFIEKRDDAFNYACRHYLAHVSDVRRRDWVQDQQEAFKRARQAECLPELDGLTNEAALELYVYGSGRVHRSPNNKTMPEHLATAIQEHGKERVVFAFGAACKAMLNPPFCAAAVIAQDYRYWIEKEGSCDSTRLPLATLFE